MLYCFINTDGSINSPKNLPNNFNNIINFKSLDDETLKSFNWYPYQLPNYDNFSQKLGNMYFDEINEVVTRTIEDIIYDLDNEKNKKIALLDKFQYDIISKKWDWMLIKEQLETYYTMTDVAKQERIDFKNYCDIVEDEILNTTDIKTLFDYNIKEKLIQYDSSYIEYLEEK